MPAKRAWLISLNSTVSPRLGDAEQTELRFAHCGLRPRLVASTIFIVIRVVWLISRSVSSSARFPRSIREDAPRSCRCPSRHNRCVKRSDRLSPDDIHRILVWAWAQTTYRSSRRSPAFAFFEYLQWKNSTVVRVSMNWNPLNRLGRVDGSTPNSIIRARTGPHRSDSAGFAGTACTGVQRLEAAF